MTYITRKRWVEIEKKLGSCPVCAGSVKLVRSNGEDCRISRECRNGFYLRCFSCDLFFGYEPDRGGMYDVGGLVELIQTWNRSLGRPVRVIMEPFTITLAAARVNAGLTQREAAKKLGTNLRYIGLYENGKLPIPHNVLKKFAKVYGIRIGQIKEAER